MRVITALELLQHFLSKLGHRDLLFCDPTYLNSLVFTLPIRLPLEHAPAASFKSLLRSKTQKIGFASWRVVGDPEIKIPESSTRSQRNGELSRNCELLRGFESFVSFPQA
jgi:hypothetical protein